MRRSILVVLLLGILSSRYVSADSPPGDAAAVAAVTDNVVHCPGNYSYQAPAGWRVRLRGDGTSSVCDLKGVNDCVAMIMVVITPRDASLSKFAQDRLDLDKRMYIKSNVQMGEMQPYSTTSGWNGFKAVETLTTNGASNRHTYYFFAGHGDDKIVVETTCHGEALDHYTPIFDDAIKTLVQE